MREPVGESLAPGRAGVAGKGALPHSGRRAGCGRPGAGHLHGTRPPGPRTGPPAEMPSRRAAEPTARGCALRGAHSVSPSRGTRRALLRAPRGAPEPRARSAPSSGVRCPSGARKHTVNGIGTQLSRCGRVRGPNGPDLTRTRDTRQDARVQLQYPAQARV